MRARVLRLFLLFNGQPAFGPPFETFLFLSERGRPGARRTDEASALRFILHMRYENMSGRRDRRRRRADRAVHWTNDPRDSGVTQSGERGEGRGGGDIIFRGKGEIRSEVGLFCPSPSPSPECGQKTAFLRQQHQRERERVSSLWAVHHRRTDRRTDGWMQEELLGAFWPREISVVVCVVELATCVL